MTFLEYIFCFIIGFLFFSPCIHVFALISLRLFPPKSLPKNVYQKICPVFPLVLSFHSMLHTQESLAPVWEVEFSQRTKCNLLTTWFLPTLTVYFPFHQRASFNKLFNIHIVDAFSYSPAPLQMLLSYLEYHYTYSLPRSLLLTFQHKARNTPLFLPAFQMNIVFHSAILT